MKFCGHTMGTYGYTTEEAIDLFVSLGFDGIDIGCNDISGITIETPEARRREIASYAKHKGLVISNLACYAGEGAGFTSLDPAVRRETVRQVKEHIRLARDLSCSRVRVFPGRDKAEGIADGKRGFEWAVKAYQELSGYAGDFGVTLLVENHPLTITITVQQTLDLVRAVDRDNVRILYDPANLWVYAGDQDVEESYRLQRERIAYVHMKDAVVLDNGTYAYTIIGRGVIPWRKILAALRAGGYDGFLAWEYTRLKKSTELLPDPDIGMKEGLAFLKHALGQTEPPRSRDTA